MLTDYARMIRASDAAEALAWLREAPTQRSITGGDGEGWRGREAIAVVEKLYDLGAVCVTAVEISGRVERARDQDTSALIVELPSEEQKRASLFTWHADFVRELGWDPTPDGGQKYMLVWRD